MARVLKFVFYFLLVDWIANFVYLNYNPTEYVAPNKDILIKSQGRIFSMSEQVRSHSIPMRVKFKNGSSIALTCSLYGRKDCYEFKDINKQENYFNQLAYQDATVLWLPIKHKKFSGRVYQIEQNGKIIIGFETFNRRYQQQALARGRTRLQSAAW